VGDPQSSETALGPLVNGAQYRKVVGLIETGIREGATLVTGGVERPDGVGQGYYVKPTVFADVDNQMTIAREEIFGPVVCMIPYDTEDDAIRIANDTPYGLAAYVASEDPAHALAVARQLRAGQVSINFAYGKAEAPFGGYKQSGNGREKGVWGLQEYLEIKGVLGVADG
jgi:aldehyde dehydrogenase (NAD+)